MSLMLNEICQSDKQPDNRDYLHMCGLNARDHWKLLSLQNLWL